MEDKHFKDFLKEQMESKNFTVAKISDHTGISERHIQALLLGETEKLPSTPYVRGYLSKIANVLELNSNVLWKIYVQEFSTPSSGPLDHLPLNRYAIRPVNKVWLTVGILAVLLFFYFLANTPHLFGEPTLKLQSPAAETTTTNFDTIPLTGAISPSDKLLIDNQEVVPNASGQFTTTYHLQPGLNQIEFTVKRFLGKELKVERKVIYQPQAGAGNQ